MGVNYGQILGMLLGTAGVTALGGHLKANKLNDYEDTLNSNLTSQGAQPLGFKHHNFSFGDYGDMQTADQSLYKQALEAHQNNAYLQDANGHLPAGVAPMQSQKYASEYSAGVTYPDQVDTLKRNKDYGETQDLMDAYSALHPPVQQQGQPAMPPMFTPHSTNQNPQLNGPQLDPGTQQQPLVGIGQGSDGSPMLGAGAMKQEPLHIKPGDYNNMLGQDQKDQELTFNKKKWSDESPTRAAKLRDLNVKIAQGEIKNKYLGQLLRSEIMRNNRPSAAGKPSSMQEFENNLQQGVKTGLWTPQEANDARRVKMGLMGKGSDSDTDTTNYNAQGNITGHTHTHRGRAGATPSAGSPGHSVDVGGGVQIRGF